MKIRINIFFKHNFYMVIGYVMSVRPTDGPANKFRLFTYHLISEDRPGLVIYLKLDEIHMTLVVIGLQ